MPASGHSRTQFLVTLACSEKYDFFIEAASVCCGPPTAVSTPREVCGSCPACLVGALGNSSIQMLRQVSLVDPPLEALPQSPRACGGSNTTALCGQPERLLETPGTGGLLCNSETIWPPTDVVCYQGDRVGNRVTSLMRSGVLVH